MQIAFFYGYTIDTKQISVSMQGFVVANYMKEMHAVNSSKRGDVVIQCHHHLSLSKKGSTENCGLKGTLDAPTINDVTSLSIPLFTEIGRRTCRR